MPGEADNLLKEWRTQGKKSKVWILKLFSTLLTWVFRAFNYLSRHGDTTLIVCIKYLNGSLDLNVFQGENLYPGIWTNFMHLCWKMQKTYKFWNYILTLLVRIIMFDVPRIDLLNSTTGKFGRLEAVFILSRRIKRKILSPSVSLSRSTGVHLFHFIMLNSPHFSIFLRRLLQS